MKYIANPTYVYVGVCMLVNYTYIYLQLFCIIIAAYITEISFGSSSSADAVYQVCYENPKAETSGHRICNSLMGVAISSILVCMVLMIFDVFIPCVDLKVMVIIIINTIHSYRVMHVR